MPPNIRHKAWLTFVRRVAEVAAGYSKEDLLTFRNIAARDYPTYERIIDGYLDLAERSDTDVAPSVHIPRRPKSYVAASTAPGEMHLFDLLRDRRLFPSNAELSSFASRILPNMRSYRFDKMSKGDITARIIEYLETRDPGTRKRLEASMRDALSTPVRKETDRRSFLSKWEKIIKEVEL